MDQAVGVDALQGAGGAQHRPFVQVEHLGCFEGEERAQPPAGTQGRIAHRLGETRLGPLGARQQLVQRHRHQIGCLGDPLGQGEGLQPILRSQENSAGSARSALP